VGFPKTSLPTSQAVSRAGELQVFGFACKYSLQIQPASTGCKYSLAPKPYTVSPNENREEESIMKRTYQASKVRRARTHGFLVRMKSRGGRAVINARRAKGRKRLAV